MAAPNVPPPSYVPEPRREFNDVLTLWNEPTTNWSEDCFKIAKDLYKHVKAKSSTQGADYIWISCLDLVNSIGRLLAKNYPVEKGAQKHFMKRQAEDPQNKDERGGVKNAGMEAHLYLAGQEPMVVQYKTTDLFRGTTWEYWKPLWKAAKKYHCAMQISMYARGSFRPVAPFHNLSELMQVAIGGGLIDDKVGLSAMSYMSTHELAAFIAKFCHNNSIKLAIQEMDNSDPSRAVLMTIIRAQLDRENGFIAKRSGTKPRAVSDSDVGEACDSAKRRLGMMLSELSGRGQPGALYRSFFVACARNAEQREMISGYMNRAAIAKTLSEGILTGSKTLDLTTVKARQIQAGTVLREITNQWGGPVCYSKITKCDKFEKNFYEIVTSVGPLVPPSRHLPLDPAHLALSWSIFKCELTNGRIPYFFQKMILWIPPEAAYGYMIHLFAYTYGGISDEPKNAAANCLSLPDGLNVTTKMKEALESKDLFRFWAENYTGTQHKKNRLLIMPSPSGNTRNIDRDDTSVMSLIDATTASGAVALWNYGTPFQRAYSDSLKAMKDAFDEDAVKKDSLERILDGLTKIQGFDENWYDRAVQLRMKPKVGAVFYTLSCQGDRQFSREFVSYGIRGGVKLLDETRMTEYQSGKLVQFSGQTFVGHTKYPNLSFTPRALVCVLDNNIEIDDLTTGKFGAVGADELGPAYAYNMEFMDRVPETVIPENFVKDPLLFCCDDPDADMATS